MGSYDGDIPREINDVRIVRSLARTGDNCRTQDRRDFKFQEKRREQLSWALFQAMML